MRGKIVLIGGGSPYFETVIGELALQPELAGWSVVLYDVNPKSMRLIRRIGGRILEMTGAKLKLSMTTDTARAFDGADFAISSIGVHGPDARWHMRDCEVCVDFGIVHTTGDTTGPAGLSQGLRIIPIYMKIARAMEKHCPDAILLQHSNPMNPICRAITKHTRINVLGYCHAVKQDIDWMGEVLGIDRDELDVTIAGPNHMCWLLDVRHKGRDVYPELKRRILRGKPQDRHTFIREALGLLDLVAIGADRHAIEFFPHARCCTDEKNLPYNFVGRAISIREGRVARARRGEPTEVQLKAAGRRKIPRPRRSPEAMGAQIRAMAFGPPIIHYVNTTNRGAVPNLPDWANIECKAIVGSGGARPAFAGELPPQAARWSMAQVQAQELMVEAAVEGCRRKALMALACDPMMLNFDEVEPLFDAIVAAQGPRLARFRKKGPSPRRKGRN